MSYIWDITIKLKRAGIDLSTITFIQPEVYSPYMEVSLENLNYIEDLEVKEIEVNALYRFENIFEPLLHLDFKGSKELQTVVFNLILNFLIQLDLKQGLCIREFSKIFISKEMDSGLFGNDIKENIKVFNMDEKDILLDSVYNYYSTNVNINIFNVILKNIFKNVITYLDKEKEFGIFIYIGEKQTNIYEKKLDVLISLFLPIYFKPYICWDKHFPVLGLDKTMMIEQNVLF